MSALIGYSVNQASLYSFKGERLNTVRAVKTLLETLVAEYGATAKIADVVGAFEVVGGLLAEEHPKYFQLTTYQADAIGTMKPCAKLLEKVLPYSSTLGITLKTVDAQLKKYGSRADAASVDNVDWKATMHALRVVDEGISLLKERSLKFPFNPEYVELLLSIKRGELPYAEVIDMLNVRLDELKVLEAESELPKRHPNSLRN